jgi:hypothetical protein
MSIGWRHFLFNEDGTIERLTQSLVKNVTQGSQRLPKYANQSIRLLMVYYETEDRMPGEYIEHSAQRWHFDEVGSPQRAILDSGWTALMDFGEAKTNKKSDKVVDASATFKKKQWKRKHLWEPTQEELKRAFDMIWKPGAPKRSKKMPKKKPSRMTGAAIDAYEKFREGVFKISSSTMHLDEEDLEALAHKLVTVDEINTNDEYVWNGVASHVQAELTDYRRWRSETGTWYAIAVKNIKNERGHVTLESLEEVKCTGRRNAERAARELRAKYAENFSVNEWIDVEICPAGIFLAPKE